MTLNARNETEGLGPIYRAVGVRAKCKSFEVGLHQRTSSRLFASLPAILSSYNQPLVAAKSVCFDPRQQEYTESTCRIARTERPESVRTAKTNIFSVRDVASRSLFALEYS